jgi:hypothetical protein
MITWRIVAISHLKDNFHTCQWPDCGKTHLKHVVHMRNNETGQDLHVGKECAKKTFGPLEYAAAAKVYRRDTLAAARLAVKQAALREEIACWEDWENLLFRKTLWSQLMGEPVFFVETPVGCAEVARSRLDRYTLSLRGRKRTADSVHTLVENLSQEVVTYLKLSLKESF